jgi:CBS domain containing-hemolysin-like protein
VKDAAAHFLHRLLADPERLLVTTLVATNMFHILALSLAVQIATEHLGDAGFWVVLVVALPVWVFFLEVLPKSLFRRIPMRALAVLSRPLAWASIGLRPLHDLREKMVDRIFAKRQAGPGKLFRGREDFKYLTFQSEREGYITSDERQIIHTVLDFRVLTAQDLLVPLEETGAVRGDLPLTAARTLAHSRGVDRLPVLGEDGVVTGLLDLHELALNGEWHGKVEMFQRRIIRVDLGESAPVVMRKLRSARLPMAVVRGTDGTSLGVVRWEDLERLLLLPAAYRAQI